jgi:hypothetical protein
MYKWSIYTCHKLLIVLKISFILVIYWDKKPLSCYFKIWTQQLKNQIIFWLSNLSDICQTFWEEYVQPESMIVDTLGVYCTSMKLLMKNNLIFQLLSSDFEITWQWLFISIYYKYKADFQHNKQLMTCIYASFVGGTVHSKCINNHALRLDIFLPKCLTNVRQIWESTLSQVRPLFGWASWSWSDVRVDI